MKKISILTLVLLAMFAFGGQQLQASSPPVEGQPLPDFQLPVPRDAADKAYLGLSGGLLSFGGGHFKVPQLKTQAVILQIFSMYCPHCQRDAPNMNTLYGIIENSRKARGKVRIIGVGAGNNPYEVGIFKKKYQVQFPLFSDADFLIHKKMGEVRTPYFVVVRILPDGSNRVVYSKLGSFGDPSRFLDSVMTMTGI